VHGGRFLAAISSAAISEAANCGDPGKFSSAVRQLSVCWDDDFRKIFHFKRFESVRSLQVEFGTFDFQYLYDLHRREFLKSFGDKCEYWSQFFYMLKLQYHVWDELVDKYVVRTGFNRSFKACALQYCS